MQPGSHHKALSLLTNFGTLIFHTIGDHETASFASNLLGQRRETFVQANSTGQEDPWDRMMGTSRMGASISESYQPVLQGEAFMTGLRCGGPPHFMVDGIVIRAGLPFRSGERWQFVCFSQK